MTWVQKNHQKVAALQEDGADTENRTRDLTLTKGALYQLSHISTINGGTDGNRTRDLLRDRQAF